MTILRTEVSSTFKHQIIKTPQSVDGSTNDVVNYRIVYWKQIRKVIIFVRVLMGASLNCHNVNVTTIIDKNRKNPASQQRHLSTTAASMK